MRHLLGSDQSPASRTSPRWDERRAALALTVASSSFGYVGGFGLLAGGFAIFACVIVFLAFTSYAKRIIALMLGLRALFFLVAGAVARFAYLHAYSRVRPLPEAMPRRD